MTLPTRSNGETITAAFFNDIKTEIESLGGTFSITTKTGDYTATANENAIFVDATSGPVTITLPAISGNDGRRYWIKKIDVSANAVTIDGDASETIDGATTYTLSNQYDWVSIIVNGTEWSIVSYTSVANAVTTDGTQTLTNKTIDVDNNTVSNIEVDNLKAGVLDTDISTVSGSDDTLASAKAIKTYVDSRNSATETLTNKTIDVDNNTVSNIEVDNLKAGVLDTDISSVSASDDTLASAKAIKTYVDSRNSATETLTNKTIDVDNNTVSNIEVDNLKAGVLDTDISTVSASDDTLASAKAIKTYVDSRNSATETLTNKTIDFDNNTVTNIEVDNLKAGVLDTDLSSVSASDDTLASAKAIKAYADSLVGVSGNVDLNYISNWDAETDTTGWATYADSAAATPATATSGTATSTFSRVTASPLRGTGSFQLSKPASNEQGEGCTFEFNLASCDKLSTMQICFNYKTSTNYASDDIRVYIMCSSDNFASDYTLITPSTYQIKKTNYGAFATTFTAHGSKTDYKLVFHIATTNANAYTIDFDTVIVRPSFFLGTTTVIPLDQQYAFYELTTSSTTTSLGDSAAATVDLDSAIEDNNALVTTGTWVYTVPETGYYMANTTITLDDGSFTELDIFYVAIQVNGSTVAQRTFTVEETSTQTLTLTVETVLDVTATDTIRVQAFQDSGGSRSYVSDAKECTMAVLKMPYTTYKGASYSATTGSITDSAYTVIDFDTSNFDP
jgi:hypothetical protein